MRHVAAPPVRTQAPPRVTSQQHHRISEDSLTPGQRRSAFCLAPHVMRVRTQQRPSTCPHTLTHTTSPHPPTTREEMHIRVRGQPNTSRSPQPTHHMHALAVAQPCAWHRVSFAARNCAAHQRRPLNGRVTSVVDRDQHTPQSKSPGCGNGSSPRRLTWEQRNPSEGLLRLLNVGGCGLLLSARERERALLGGGSRFGGGGRRCL